MGLCLSDSPEGKKLLMDSKWLQEVNKQSFPAATASHQTLVTATAHYENIQRKKQIYNNILWADRRSDDGDGKCREVTESERQT